MYEDSKSPNNDSVEMHQGEGLEAFASDAELAAAAKVPDPAPARRPDAAARVRVARIIVAVLLLSGTVATGATWQYTRRATAQPAVLAVESTQPGLDVTIADRVVGKTPVSLSLAPGVYTVSVSSGSERRDMIVQLAPGAFVVRHVDVAARAAAAPTPTAAPLLRIETLPAPMTVSVDGVVHGVSPVDIKGLAARTHEVLVTGGGAQLRHKVALRAGESTVLVLKMGSRTEAPAAPAPAAGGWLSVTSFIPAQIRDGGKVIGSTEADRIMLPTGQHVLEFVNEPLGYTSRRTVRIEPAKTVTISLERVNGKLSINAQPWAEVWVDGERVGETPIGNLSRAIGTHEVVLRHPQLGERRERVTITADQPARLGIDLRRKQ